MHPHVSEFYRPQTSYHTHDTRLVCQPYHTLRASRHLRAQHLRKLVHHHYLHLVAAAVSADSGVDFWFAISKLGVASITAVKLIEVYIEFAYFGQVNFRF